MNRDIRHPGQDGDSTVRELHSDLELTRVELGETLAALIAKVDLKSRAQEYAQDSADRLAEATHTLRREAGQRTAWLAGHRNEITLAGVALGAFTAGLLACRRSRMASTMDE